MDSRLALLETDTDWHAAARGAQSSQARSTWNSRKPKKRITFNSYTGGTHALNQRNRALTTEVRTLWTIRSTTVERRWMNNSRHWKRRDPSSSCTPWQSWRKCLAGTAAGCGEAQRRWLQQISTRDISLQKVIGCVRSVNECKFECVRGTSASALVKRSPHFEVKENRIVCYGFVHCIVVESEGDKTLWQKTESDVSSNC